MHAEQIRKELRDFQQAVKMLSSGIQQAEASWSDEKYEQLAALIREIASASRQVSVSGERTCEALRQFEKVAGEEC